MKKITQLGLTQTNKRSFAVRWASAIVCFALLLLGTTAFAAAPVNDDFANATVFSGTSATGSNVDATRQTGDPTTVKFPGNADTTAGDRSVWWTWTAPSTGPVTFATGPDSTFDTQLGVYTGTLGSLVEIASNEDATNFAGGLSLVSFNAQSGTVYHIMVNGFEDATGTINLHLSSGGTVVTGFILTVNHTGNGTVTQDPAQPASGYDTNTVVTVVAHPAGTNTFLGWSGTTESDANLTNTVVMSSDKSVTAAFTGYSTPGTNKFTLTILKTPSNSAGTVRKVPNKARYNENEVVTVIARAARSRTFLGWTGTDEGSADQTNTVTMTSDKTITAAFSEATHGGGGGIPSVFLPVVGTYNGLFFNSEVTTNCSGYFTIKVSKTGRFTVQLKLAGKTLAGRGQLDTNGVGTATIGKAPGPIITVDIQLDITGADPKITGTVTTPDCTSPMQGDRVVFSAKNASPIQGIYTFVLPRGITNDSVVTNVVVVTNGTGTNATFTTNTTFVTNNLLNPGHSFGTLTVSKSGQAKIRGSLADGTKFSQSTTVSANGEIPLFVSLYRGHGFLTGWLHVTQDDVSGNPVNWKRPAGGTLFTTGFDVDIALFGSRFDRTVNPFINISSNAVVEIGANNSSTGSLLIPVELRNANTVVEAGTNGTSGLQIKLLPTGLVRGKFISTITGKNTLLQGAMIQSSNAAFGFFLSKDTSGFFELRNQP